MWRMDLGAAKVEEKRTVKSRDSSRPEMMVA